MTTRRCWFWAAWLCFVGLIAATGCETTSLEPEHAENPMMFPRIADIRSQVGLRGESQADGPVVANEFLVIALPRTIDLTPYFNQASRGSLDPEMVERWAANGMHMAVIKRRDARSLAESLPDIVKTHSLSIIPPKDRPVAARFLPAHRQPVIFRYFTTPPENLADALFVAPDTLLEQADASVSEVPRGQFGFLLLSDHVMQDRVLVRVTPHCHWVQPSVRVRSPLDTYSDGESFEALETSVLMERADVLLIGYNPMPPPPESLPDEIETEILPPEDDLTIHDFPFRNLDIDIDRESLDAMASENDDQPYVEVPSESAKADDDSTEGDQDERSRQFEPMHRLGELLTTHLHRGEPVQLLIMMTPDVLGPQLRQPETPAPPRDPNLRLHTPSNTPQ